MPSSSRRHLAATAAGAAVGVGARAATRQALLVLTRRAFESLNRGDIRPGLRLYARQATLRQGQGMHRWAGEHTGRQEIGRFLQDMVDARISLHVRDLWFSGAPWALRAVVLFDERGHDHDHEGAVVYENQLTCVLRTRGLRVIDHTDLVLSSLPLEAFERRLRDETRATVGVMVA